MLPFSQQVNLQASGIRKGRRGTKAGLMGVGNRGAMMGGGGAPGAAGLHKNHPHMAKLLHNSNNPNSMGMSTDNSGEDSDEDRLDADLDDRMSMMDEELGGGGIGVGSSSDVTIGPDGKKKRLRKPMRLGIGGFMVRGNRGRGSFAGRGRLPLGRGSGGDDDADGAPGADDAAGVAGDGKAKKKGWRRKKVKGLIEEAYPSYLQDAFFGRPLLDIPSASGLNISDEEDTEEVWSVFLRVCIFHWFSHYLRANFPSILITDEAVIEGEEGLKL